MDRPVTAHASCTPAGPKPLPPHIARQILEELEASYWKSVQEAGTAGAYGRYLEIYPEGRFAALARHAASPEE